MILQAENQEELVNKLSAADISVPRRDDGRTTEHREIYCVFHLLAGLILSDLIKYPTILCKRESPDFLLKTGNIHIGIEHTDATSEDYAKEQAIRKKFRDQGEDIGDGFSVPTIRPNDSLTSTSVIKNRILRPNPSMDFTVGREDENIWIDSIIHAIQRKINKINKREFDTFEQNWLLIYDAWPLRGLGIEEKDEVSPELVNKLNDEKAFNSIDYAFVVCAKKHQERCIYQFSSAGFSRHDINIKLRTSRNQNESSVQDEHVVNHPQGESE
ncbi:MAG: hypothetical protein ACLFOY_16445 [Desulfatibacillaceae bacterium]